jgi:hypothetical protein
MQLGRCSVIFGYPLGTVESHDRIMCGWSSSVAVNRRRCSVRLPHRVVAQSMQESLPYELMHVPEEKGHCIVLERLEEGRNALLNCFVRSCPPSRPHFNCFSDPALNRTLQSDYDVNCSTRQRTWPLYFVCLKIVIILSPKCATSQHLVFLYCTPYCARYHFWKGRWKTRGETTGAHLRAGAMGR